jgi:hypothetical protein
MRAARSNKLRATKQTSGDSPNGWAGSTWAKTGLQFGSKYKFLRNYSMISMVKMAIERNWDAHNQLALTPNARAKAE